MKEKLLIAWEWTKRNLTWLIIGLGALLISGWNSAVLHTILIVSVFWALGTALAGISLYAYTRINFIRILEKDDDRIITIEEKTGVYNLLGRIFQSLMIMIGLVVLGVYIVQTGM
ncbi:MAG: hypothetical protein ABFD61_03840 [Chloroherpetonaceae bacterium]|jgi:hypothetical protein